MMFLHHTYKDFSAEILRGNTSFCSKSYSRKYFSENLAAENISDDLTAENISVDSTDRERIASSYD